MTPLKNADHAGAYRLLANTDGQGKVIIFGPVMDPRGPHGMGIVEAENEDAIRAFIEGDPASRINTYEFYLMRAVLPA